MTSNARQSFTIQDKNTTYCLPLDDLDDSLIAAKLAFGDRSTTSPIWNQSYLKWNEHSYYEFEVRAERYHENEDNTTKIPCHICNIYIPDLFMKEHNNSNRHKNCLKITEHALERAKKHMSQNIETSNNNTPNMMHFCETCAVAVKFTDIIDHENSQEHAVSIAYNKILSSLAIAYVDKEKFIVDYKIKSDHIDNSLNCLLRIDTSETIAKTEKADLNEYIRNIIGVRTEHSLCLVNEDMIEVRTVSGHRVQVSIDNFHGFFTRGEVVQCRVCRDIVDRDEHILDRVHIEKLRAPILDKHCVRQLDELWYHCIICNEIIGCVEVHTSCCDEHINLLKKALIYTEDELNASSSKTEASKTQNPQTVDEMVMKVHFCDVCTINIPNNSNNIREHYEGRKHKRLASEINAKNNINANVEDKIEKDNLVSHPAECYCEYCKIKVESSKAHNSSLDHRSKLWQSKHPVHHLLRKTDTKRKLLCDICKIDVKNDKVYLDGHINSVEHQSKYESLLQSNKLRIKDDLCFCEPCGTQMLEIEILCHISGKKHQTNLTEIEQRNELEDVKQNLEENNILSFEGASTDCQVQYHNNPEHISIENIHDETANTKEIEEENKLESGSALQEVKTTPNKTSIDIYSDIKQSETKLNVENLDHKLKETILIKSNVTEPPKISDNEAKSKKEYITNSDKHENPINATSPSTIIKKTITNYRHLLESTKNTEVVHCVICKINLKNIDNEKYAHLVNPAHSAQYNMLLASNKLRQVIVHRNMTYFCMCCSITIPPCSMIHHIQDHSHKLQKDKMRNEIKPVENPSRHTREEDNLKVSDNTQIKTGNSAKTSVNNTEINREQNIKPNNIVKGYIAVSDKTHKTIHYLMSHTDDGIVCKSCNVKVPNHESNINEHVRGNNHNAKYNNLLISHKINKVGNLLYCQICSINLNPDTEIDHIDGRKHKSKIFQLNLQPSTSGVVASTSNALPPVNATSKPSQQLHYLMKKTNYANIVACKICDITIQNNLSHILDHVRSIEHNNLYDAILDKSKIIKVGENKYSCNLCQINLTKVNGYDHASSEGHNKIRLASIVRDTLKSTNNDNNTSKAKHNSEYYCKICDCYVTKHDKNIKEHNNGALHKAKLSQSRSNTSSEVSINSASKTQEKIEAKVNTLHYLMDKTNRPDSVMCKICKVQVPNNNSCVSVHIKGSAHTSHYNNFLISNQVKVSGPGKHYCELCRVNVVNVVDHVNNSQHKKQIFKKSISNDKSFDYCDLCNVEYNTSLAEHRTSAQHVQNYHRMRTNYYCDICLVSVPNDPSVIKAHEEGLMHKEIMNKTLVQNEITVKGKVCFCKLCNLYFGKMSVLNHIGSDSHKRAMPGKSNDV